MVRTRRAIRRKGMPPAAKRLTSVAMASASAKLSAHCQRAIRGPGLRPADSDFSSRRGLLAISAEAAATMFAELRRLRPMVRVAAPGKARAKRSRLASDAPRNR